LTTIANRKHANAVVFDLEQPIVAIKRLAAAFDDLEQEFVGAKPGSYFSEKRRSLKRAYRRISSSVPCL